MKMEKSGAAMILEALRKEHVDIVFGYPGGAVIPLFDALYDAPDIKLVMTRHEQAAVHAADGYARTTGRVGVCIVTSGPGATNTVTGLATAKLDSVPIVCITGQVSRSLLGNDAFQEVDTIGITQPVTKHNFMVSERELLPRRLKEAFVIAATGRPGPVVIDIPKDIQIEKCDDAYPETASVRSCSPSPSALESRIPQLAEALRDARKPLFFIGGGMAIADATDLFSQLLEKVQVPFATSLMGIGVMDTNHPLNLGMLGMHGTIAANRALAECDLLVGLGVRFDDRAIGNPDQFAPLARIAQVDIDPSSIGKNIRVDLAIEGDLRSVLEALIPAVSPVQFPQWLSQIEEFRKYQKAVQNRHKHKIGNTDEMPRPQEVLSMVREVFPDAIIATEVGQNQMWAAQYIPFSRPREWLTSGGLGTMGYGLPAGLGAQAAHPDRPVVVIAGDGSIQMNIQELATLVQENLPLIVVILDNGYLGMVRQWQELFASGRYASTCLKFNAECRKKCGPGAQCSRPSLDFAAIARAYGAEGFMVDNLPMFRAACLAARKLKKPTVIDCLIAREENVWPIVPPGKSNSEMVYEGERV